MIQPFPGGSNGEISACNTEADLPLPFKEIKFLIRFVCRINLTFDSYSFKIFVTLDHKCNLFSQYIMKH